MSSTRTATRTHNYHGGTKGRVVGTVVQPAPAWRARNIPAESRDPGGKVLLSNLPPDVAEEEIVDLMKKTIGPVNLRESFMIYNVKGFPRGMALVSFVRGIDATKARERYNGKVIDGKRAIKLEIVLDRSDAPTATRPPNVPKGPKAQPKSLFERIGPASPSDKQARQQLTAPPRPPKPAGTKRPVILSSAPHQPRAHAVPSTSMVPPAPIRKRQKKGPRRVKKSIADLDLEMEEYSAARANGIDARMQVV